MAKAVVNYDADDVHSAPVNAAAAAELVEGVFVGINSSGELVPADYQTGEGPVVARGVATESAIKVDGKGNPLQTLKRLAYVQEARVSGYAGLTPGADQYLSSGGGITEADPASDPGDITQVVAYALTDELIVLRLGDKVVAT